LRYDENSRCSQEPLKFALALGKLARGTAAFGDVAQNTVGASEPFGGSTRILVEASRRKLKNVGIAATV